MNDVPQQPQGYPWMQLPQVQFPQQQNSGYGDLAGALVGRGVGLLKNRQKLPGKQFADSPMPKDNPLPIVGALAGLPMNA